MNYPVVTVSKAWEKYLKEHCYGSAGPRPSVIGIRKLYWGDCPIVRCGQYIYRVSFSDYWACKNNPNGKN